jgi:hypothetical protein
MYVSFSLSYHFLNYGVDTPKLDGLNVLRDISLAVGDIVDILYVWPLWWTGRKEDGTIGGKICACFQSRVAIKSCSQYFPLTLLNPTISAI